MQFKRFKTTILSPTDGTSPSVSPPIQGPAILSANEMSQFKRPHPSGHGIPPTAKTSQSELPQIHRSNSLLVDGLAQFKAPLTPWHGLPFAKTPTQVGQTQQVILPGSGDTHRAAQFKAPPASTLQPANVDPRIRQRVALYANWLARQAKYDVLHDNTSEINDYIQNATKVVKVGEKDVATFAPFRPELSALQTITTRQAAVLCAIAVLWILGLIVFRLEMLTAVIAAITLIYLSNLLLNVLMAIGSLRHLPVEKIDDTIVHALKDADWPLYTILCPLYREASVVPQFVEAMRRLDYPAEKLQVLFLTEVDDIETRNAIRSLSLPVHFKIVTVPDGKPRTKPRACNYGLMQATGPYIVIYDAEDIPDPLQLKKAVLAFANHGTEVVCIQAGLLPNSSKKCGHLETSHLLFDLDG